MCHPETGDEFNLTFLEEDCNLRSLNENWNMFISTLRNSMIRFFPKKQISSMNNLPMTRDILRLIRKKENRKQSKTNTKHSGLSSF